MEIKYLGHSCFSINFGGKNLLFDPFITSNDLAKSIDIQSIKADYILLSHGHADHVADVELIAKNNPAVKLISSFEIITWFGKKGIDGHPMNTGGKWEFDFGTLKCVSAVHSNSLPDESYGGVAMGFVISNASSCFYFAGDTALHSDMKLIPSICPKLDAAILPIGDNFTMGFQDAILASDFIQCNKIIGCHYDTFGYIKIDHAEAKEAFTAAEKDLVLLEVGAITNI